MKRKIAALLIALSALAGLGAATATAASAHATASAPQTFYRG